jgi:hypothetical protein
MALRCLAVVIAVLVLALPAVALARFPVGGPAKSPLVKTALGAKVPRQCAAVYISSKDHSWGSVSFAPQHGWSSRCTKYGSNGVAILHRVQDKWHVVADGSDFTCPIPHVPAAVAQDLRVCG